MNINNTYLNDDKSIESALDDKSIELTLDDKSIELTLDTPKSIDSTSLINLIQEQITIVIRDKLNDIYTQLYNTLKNGKSHLDIISTSSV